MKKLMCVLMLCLLAGMASAQVQSIPVVILAAPVGDCRVQFYQLAYVPSTQVFYGCNGTSGVWTSQASLGGLTLTASTGTFTLANGKTFVVNNGITLAGTDSTIMTFPTTSATIARTDAANTFTGVQTMTSPVLTTPSLGVATATSINGNAITTGTGTLTLATGKTLTASNTLTLAGTDATTMTFPTTSATVARTDAANTFTGVQTMTSAALTTPTLTNPILNGPAPVACGSTCTVATTQAGTVRLIDTAAGSAATLPTSSGSGNIYKFRITVANSSNQDKILLTTTADVIIGTAIGENAGTAKVFVGNAGTYHSIQMPFAGTQPSGGFVGDQITCTDIATGTYACDVNYQAGTTPTTPYSTSTT